MVALPMFVYHDFSGQLPEPVGTVSVFVGNEEKPLVQPSQMYNRTVSMDHFTLTEEQIELARTRSPQSSSNFFKHLLLNFIPEPERPNYVAGNVCNRIGAPLLQFLTDIVLRYYPMDRKNETVGHPHYNVLSLSVTNAINASWRSSYCKKTKASDKERRKRMSFLKRKSRASTDCSVALK